MAQDCDHTLRWPVARLSLDGHFSAIIRCGPTSSVNKSRTWTGDVINSICPLMVVVNMILNVAAAVDANPIPRFTRRFMVTGHRILGD